MWCLVLRARNFITDRSDRGLYIIINMSIEFFSYVFVLVEIFTECEKKQLIQYFQRFCQCHLWDSRKSSLRLQSVRGVFGAPFFAKVHGHPSHANARIHLKGDNGDVKKKGNTIFNYFSGIRNVYNQNCWRIIS